MHKILSGSSTYHKLLYSGWEGGRIKQNLTILVLKSNNILNEDDKVLREQLVGLGKEVQWSKDRHSAWQSICSGYGTIYVKYKP